MAAPDGLDPLRLGRDRADLPTRALGAARRPPSPSIRQAQLVSVPIRADQHRATDRRPGQSRVGGPPALAGRRARTEASEASGGSERPLTGRSRHASAPLNPPPPLGGGLPAAFLPLRHPDAPPTGTRADATTDPPRLKMSASEASASKVSLLAPRSFKRPSTRVTPLACLGPSTQRAPSSVPTHHPC